MTSYLLPLITLVTFPMAVRDCFRMFAAGKTSRRDQWVQLVALLGLLAWLVWRARDVL